MSNKCQNAPRAPLDLFGPALFQNMPLRDIICQFVFARDQPICSHMPGQGNMIDFTVLNSFPLSFSFSVSDSFNKKPVLTDLLCEGEGEKLDSVCVCV